MLPTERLLLTLLTCLAIFAQHQTKEDGLHNWCLFYGPHRCRCNDQEGDLSLNCSKGNLSSVPELSEDSKWLLVDLSLNSLQALGKYEFAKVTISRLDLSHCELGTLHRNTFALSRGIEHLSLAHNLLTTLPIQTAAHLPMLKLLDLSYNPLLKADLSPILSPFTQLRTLVLDGLANLTTGLDLSKLDQLQLLSINNAKLSKLPADKMRFPKSLRNLTATNNAISTLANSDELCHIVYLNLSNNLLESFPHRFKSDSLMVLDLTHNKIKRLQGFAFAYMPALSRAYLGNNTIINVEESFLCSAGQNLSLVDLSNNSLQEFPLCALTAHNASMGLKPRLILSGNTVACNCSVTNISSSWSIWPDTCWLNDSVSASFRSNPCSAISTTSCPSVCTMHSESSKGRLSGKSSKHNSATTRKVGCLLLFLLIMATASL